MAKLNQDNQLDLLKSKKDALVTKNNNRKGKDDGATPIKQTRAGRASSRQAKRVSQSKWLEVSARIVVPKLQQNTGGIRISNNSN